MKSKQVSATFYGEQENARLLLSVRNDSIGFQLSNSASWIRTHLDAAQIARLRSFLDRAERELSRRASMAERQQRVLLGDDDWIRYCISGEVVRGVVVTRIKMCLPRGSITPNRDRIDSIAYRIADAVMPCPYHETAFSDEEADALEVRTCEVALPAIKRSASRKVAAVVAMVRAGWSSHLCCQEKLREVRQKVVRFNEDRYLVERSAPFLPRLREAIRDAGITRPVASRD